MGRIWIITHQNKEQDCLLVGQKTGSFLESKHISLVFSYQLFTKNWLSTDYASGTINAFKEQNLHELEKQQHILPKGEKKANGGLDALVKRVTALKDMLIGTHKTKQTKLLKSISKTFRLRVTESQQIVSWGQVWTNVCQKEQKCRPNWRPNTERMTHILSQSLNSVQEEQRILACILAMEPIHMNPAQYLSTNGTEEGLIPEWQSSQGLLLGIAGN